MARLVLWDVDGTLIYSKGIGASVFDRAFEHVLGLAPSARISERIVLSGKTDPQIAREYLVAMGVDDPERHIDLVLKLVEVELVAAASALAAIGGTMPGIPGLLARLSATDGVHQTLLTGNLAANGRVKVEAFGLDRWLDLDIGAYGSDDEDRRMLVPIAQERARRLRGLEVAPEGTWVVGDTARDLECARAAGVRCLLVATGNSTLSELARLKPDAVMSDLADTDAVVDVLTA